jgi:hypothetical protein
MVSRLVIWANEEAQIKNVAVNNFNFIQTLLKKFNSKKHQ